MNCKHCHTEISAPAPMADGTFRCPHCNSVILPSESDAELRPGSTLCGFEIVKLLGRGGMGNVYLATQVSMQRFVALKVLPKALTANSSAVMKFLNEVKNSGCLQHPHIVAAIDAGEDNGTYFLAMQYVDGMPLETIIDKEGHISEDDALDYAIMIAEALKYAWDRKNIFHKDIKPGNIMIDNVSGDALLLDMGISQRIGESDGNDGHVEGSPFYMSPEQTKGEKLNWSTDLYSLGATLYNAIVGVPPYDDREIMRIVEMHSASPFPEPSVRNPGVKVHPAVVALIKKMMAKKPDDRFKSWADFIKECTKVRKSLDAKTTKRKFLKTKTGNHKVYTSMAGKGGGMSMLLVVNLLLFGILALGGGAFAYTYINKMNAKKDIESAESYITRQGFDYSIALSRFANAKESASKLGVPASFKRRALDGYNSIKAAADKRVQELAQFESAMKTAALHFSKAKEIHLQANEFTRLKKGDNSTLLENSMKEAKLAFSCASEIKTEEYQYMQRVDQFKDAVSSLIKQLEKDFAAKAKAVAKAKADAEEKAIAAAEAAKQSKEAEALVNKYTSDLAKIKNDLRLIYVLAIKKREFTRGLEKFSEVEMPSHPEGMQFRREELAHEVWTKATSARLERAAALWASICDSNKKFAGTMLAINGKPFSIGSISDLKLISANGKDKIALDDLSAADLTSFLKRVTPADSKADVFAFLLGNGNFAEAAEFAPDENARKEISAVAKTYIKARMQKALRDRQIGDSSSFDKLKAEYGYLPEYDAVVSELGFQ